MVERMTNTRHVAGRTLAVALGASTSPTTLTPDSYTGFPAAGQGTLVVGNPQITASVEVVKVTNWATHPWPILRAQDGSTAVSHAIGDGVDVVLSETGLGGLVGWYEGATFRANAIEVEFDATNFDIDASDPAKPVVSLGGTSAPTTLTIPGATTPAQTAEGSAVWDTDGDVLTVGTGAGRKTLVNGDDARLTDARTPTAHATSHNAGGGDALAIDAAVGTGSLRTLGTGSAQAAAGDHAHTQYATGTGGTIDHPTVSDYEDFTDQGGDPSSPASGAHRVYTKAGGVYVKTSAGAVVGPLAAGGTSLYSAYLCYQDQKTAGTHGGGFTSGAWRTRDLNTEVADTGGHGSVASNQITLAAGTYRVRATAPAVEVDRHMLRLQDITNTATLVWGQSAFTNNNAGTTVVQTNAELVGRFTLAGSTVIELQHQCSTTVASFGFGFNINVSFTVDHETYSIVEFWKES